MRRILDIMIYWKGVLIISTLFLCFQASSYAADFTLQWDANTEPDLAGYEIYYGTSSGDYNPADADYADQGSSPITIAIGDPGFNENNPEYTLTGLTDDKVYFIALTAYDNEDPSLRSGYSNEVDTKAPQITSPPTVTSITDTTATIEWNTDEPGTSIVEYMELESNDPYNVEALIGYYITNHSVTLTSLSSETTYKFRVSSTDAGGNGPDFAPDDNNPSDVYTFTTEPTHDTTAPQITSPPTVTSITDTTAVIEWQTDEPSNSMVQYDDNSSTWGNYQWSKSDTSMVTNHSFTLTELNENTTYYFRVGSADAFGNGPTTSNEVNFTTGSSSDTTAPQITAPPTVTGMTKTTAIIEWQTDEPSNSLVDYGLTASYGSQARLADYVTNHSVTLTGLTADTNYHFRVGSTDAAGNGPTYSNDCTFKTKTGDDQAPQITSPPTVTNITDSTAIITWETDEPSNSMVRYDTTSRTAWGDYLLSEDDAGMVTSHSVTDAGMVTSHSVTLTGLTAGGTYHFMVGSTDAFGNGPDPTPPNANNNPTAQQNFITELTSDSNAPIISNARAIYTTNTTAIIVWRTDEASNSMVQYGTSSSTWGNYLWSKNNAGMVTIHFVSLTGLSGNTTYYFRVGSNDASGNGPDLNSNSTNPSAQKDFTTKFTSDTAAPVISNVDVPLASMTDTTAVITWTTDEPSNSMVRYDTTSRTAWGDYLLSEDDAGMVTSHSVTALLMPLEMGPLGTQMLPTLQPSKILLQNSPLTLLHP
jgi:hypothetical protein